MTRILPFLLFLTPAAAQWPTPGNAMEAFDFHPLVADIQAGRDTALERALAFLKSASEN